MKVILTSLSALAIDTLAEDKKKSSKGSIVENDYLYPLGLSYIQSYLESKNHEVRYLDLLLVKFYESKEFLTNQINSFHPDVIGFSMLTDNHVTTYKMIEYIHETYPEIKIVVGGIHATIMYEQLINKYPYIIVVIGDGEITFGEILEDRPLNSIKGIVFYSNGKIIKTENRELCDLDSLPFPSHGNPERTRVNIITSRGCPFSCSFCVLNPNARRIQRMRSVKNVVDEIESVAKKYPNLKSIYFLDDAFLTNNKRAIEICDEIIKRGLNYIEFQCQARFKPFHKEIIPYLEKANFTALYFGLETANETMLKACHKSFKQQDVIDTITLLKDSKIKVNTFLIVGLPGETKETIIETAEFVQELQKIKYIMYYDYNPAILMVFPGTEIYETMKATGKITDDYWLTNNPSLLYTVEHPLEELIQFKKNLTNRIAFMPLSLTKLYYQKSLLIPIFKYTIKYYYTSPMTLIKIILRSI